MRHLQHPSHALLPYVGDTRVPLHYRPLPLLSTIHSEIFPNLKNLAVEYLYDETRTPPWISVPLVVSQSPPLRGHFQLIGLILIDPDGLEITFDLLNGINFRSIDFRDVHWKHGQHGLDGYVRSLEELTTYNVGEMRSLPRSFRAAKIERFGSYLQITRTKLSQSPGK